MLSRKSDDTDVYDFKDWRLTEPTDTGSFQLYRNTSP